MGLRLSQEKTLITHIEQGLDFLGWRIQRHRKPGTSRRYVYTYPGQEGPPGRHGQGQDAVPTGRDEPAARCPAAPAQPGVRGWCAYFRPGVSAATFSYLRYYLWHTVWRWVRRKHPKTTRKKIRRRYCGRGSWWASENRELFNPVTVGTTRYRYRGAASPLHGPPQDEDNHHGALRGLWRAGCDAKSHARFGKRLRGNGPVERPEPRPGPTSPSAAW